MRITCPTCAAAYEVAEDAVGTTGRKVRCRACGASWHQPSPHAVSPHPVGPTPPPVAPLLVDPVEPPPAVEAPAPLSEPAVTLDPVQTSTPAPIPPPKTLGLRTPFIALALVIAALVLGGAIATIVFGPDRMASELGLADRRVPLGISITRQPDWRMIAGGSELFAVSGRIWNPTHEVQTVPDIRAELKDASGRTVYRWTITRPVAQLAPGQGVDFDGAAVDVPRSSANVAVTFAGSGAN